MEPVHVGEYVIVHQLGVDRAGYGPKHEHEEELEPEQRPRRHLALRHPEVVEEDQIREKRRAEQVPLNQLPLLCTHTKGIDSSCRRGHRLGRNSAVGSEWGPRALTERGPASSDMTKRWWASDSSCIGDGRPGHPTPTSYTQSRSRYHTDRCKARERQHRGARVCVLSSHPSLPIHSKDILLSSHFGPVRTAPSRQVLRVRHDCVQSIASVILDSSRRV